MTDDQDPLESYVIRRVNAPTLAERREATRTLLLSDPAKSDRLIAKTVGVCREMVSGIRRDMQKSGKIATPVLRKGTDGKVYRLLDGETRWVQRGTSRESLDRHPGTIFQHGRFWYWQPVNRTGAKGPFLSREDAKNYAIRKR